MACRARRSPTRTSQRSRALAGHEHLDASVEHRAQRARRRSRRGGRGRGRSRAPGRARRASTSGNAKARRARTSVSSQWSTSSARPARRHSAARKPDVPGGRVGDEDRPVERRAAPRSATAANRGAPASSAASIPCTCAAPPTRSPGSTSVLSRATRSPPTTRSMQTSTTRSRATSRPVISRSTNASGASASGKSQGGPGGGGALEVIGPVSVPRPLPVHEFHQEA